MIKRTDLIAGMILSIVALMMQIAMFFVGAKDILKYLSAVAAALAALCSFIYYFNGGIKKSAMWRTMFCILLSISLLLSFIRAIQTGRGAINVVCLFLTFAITAYLSFAKDLGKTNSIRLASVVVFLQIITIISELNGPGSVKTPKLLGILSSTTLVLLLLGTTYIKYYDKEQRGQK